MRRSKPVDPNGDRRGISRISSQSVSDRRRLKIDVEGADWREVARIVLHLDPEHESERARRAFDSHLSRAKWMTEHGYRHLLRGGASA
jgi:hypothetical protein